MSASNNQQARIFIIEDDPIMRGMVVDYLEQHNMRRCSASGRQDWHHFTASGRISLCKRRLGQG
jgi:DNA-binding response OmpR family regulator